MTREWILSVLDLLPVWRWPLFLWDLARLRLWADELAPDVRGYASIVVTREGRIVILNVFEADRHDPSDWTQFAPRAPWEALELECAPVLPVAHIVYEPSADSVDVYGFQLRSGGRIQAISGPG